MVPSTTLLGSNSNYFATNYFVLVSLGLPDFVFVKLVGKETIIDMGLPLRIVDIHPVLKEGRRDHPP